MSAVRTAGSLDREQVEDELNRILSSQRFATADRHTRFLRYIVEMTLEGRAGEIKETVIAADLYGRGTNYDSRSDSFVRVEATRLRARLRTYYETEGSSDPVIVSIPKGTYVPHFELRDAAPEAPAVVDVPITVPVPPPIQQYRWFSVIAVVALVCALAMIMALVSNNRSVDPEAKQAWMEGVQLLNIDPYNAAPDHGTPAPLLRAIERFEFAAAKDPSFARGWASLAEAYDYSASCVGRDHGEDMRRAERAADRAIAADPKLAAAHHMKGAVLFFLKWHFAEAEAAYRRALELEPTNAQAAVEFADLLRETGRVQEAEDEIRKVRAMLPGLPRLLTKEAEILLDLRRPDAALALLREAEKIDQESRKVQVMLGFALETKGDVEGAFASYRRALASNPRDRFALPAYGYLLARTGRRDEAKSVLETLRKMDRELRHVSCQIAVVELALGNRDDALEALDKAYQDKQAHLPFSAIEPRFAELHDDPRFREMLSRVGLQPVRTAD